MRGQIQQFRQELTMLSNCRGKSKVFNDQFETYGAIFLFFAKNIDGRIHYKWLKQTITAEVRSAGVVTLAGAVGVVMYCAEASNWPLFIAKLAATAVIAKSVGDTIDVLTAEKSHLSNELVFISDCIRKGHLTLNEERDVMLTISTD